MDDSSIAASELATLQNSPGGSIAAHMEQTVRKDVVDNILAIGKVTSSKWLPQVNSDKKKMNQTRITIGVGEVNQINAQHFHSNQPQLANLRAT